MGHRQARDLFWLLAGAAVACGARTELSGNVDSAIGGFPTVIGGRNAAPTGGSSGGPSAQGGAPAVAGSGGSAGLTGHAGANPQGGAAGVGGTAGGATGGACSDPKFSFVTPANATNDVDPNTRVRVGLSCPPKVVSDTALTLSGAFTGPLDVTFPMQTEPSVLTVLPFAPDGTGRVPYFPGELVSGWLGAELGGPRLWQYRAAVRAGSSGQFEDSGQMLDSGRDVALGDLDQDGDLDAISSTRYGGAPSVLWENDGAGRFIRRGILVADARSLLIDLDGDGALDIASSSVFLNQGDFVFVKTEALGEAYATGDFDADGDQDVITAVNSSTGPCALRVNDGHGHFTSVAFAVAYCADIQAGDLDNDGTLDLVAVVWDGSPAKERGSVLLNNGLGSFKEVSTFGVDASRSLALGDLDGDGDLDLFVGSWGAAGARNPPDQVWLNDGRAHFSLGSSPFSGSVEIVLGDLDGDGDLDAVAGNHDPYSVTPGQPSVLLRNDGHGVFTADGQLGGNNFQHVRLGDLNGDGNLDAVVAQWDWSKEPPLQVWLQRF